MKSGTTSRIVTGLTPRRQVAHLECPAAFGGRPRAVLHARRAAGVHARRERLAETGVGHRSLEDVDLFPEVVDLDAVRAGVSARREVEDPGRHPGAGDPRKDPLGELRDGPLAGRPVPAGDREELVLRLAACHQVLLSRHGVISEYSERMVASPVRSSMASHAASRSPVDGSPGRAITWPDTGLG